MPHHPLFFFLTILESVFYSALLNVANMILNVFFLGGGGRGGVGRKGQLNQATQNEQPMKVELRLTTAIAVLKGPNRTRSLLLPFYWVGVIL